jgi:hypothetical protein
MMLAKELEISYKAAWFMFQRIRKAMKDQDSQYLVARMVELDDAYFGSPDEGGKRGRGTSKAKVMLGLSLNDEGHPQFLKMQVVNNLKKETIAEFAHSNLQIGSTISSDAYRSYQNLQEKGYKLEAKVFKQKEDREHLK